MHRSSWKKGEARLAALFGTVRTPLSGGNSRHTRSDTLHEKLFLERKHRAKHAAVTLWRKTKTLADKEGKIPVPALAEIGKMGHWFLIHENDLKAVADCLASAEAFYVSKVDAPTVTEEKNHQQ